MKNIKLSQIVLHDILALAITSISIYGLYSFLVFFINVNISSALLLLVPISVMSFSAYFAGCYIKYQMYFSSEKAIVNMKTALGKSTLSLVVRIILYTTLLMIGWEQGYISLHLNKNNIIGPIMIGMSIFGWILLVANYRIIAARIYFHRHKDELELSSIQIEQRATP